MRSLRRAFSKHHAHGSHEKKQLLTHAQMGILFVFSEGETKTTKEIAERFHVSSSAATQVINRLVKDKLLSRETDAKDRRKVTLVLTLQGKKMLQKTQKAQYAKIGKMFEALSDKELETFIRLQEKVMKHWKEIHGQ
ncbi:MAG TPA: MarR family transcriptional regulator [Candidatus Paceibacterota bacterium]|nr:MarR family transcriptional regulator [Candidatus Paceibacterota bacterium]